MKKSSKSNRPAEPTVSEQCAIVAVATKNLYESFLAQGFTTEQAFSLTKGFIAEGLIDYLI